MLDRGAAASLDGSFSLTTGNAWPEHAWIDPRCGLFPVRRIDFDPLGSQKLMYIKTQDGFGDGDLANLEKLLALIDGELSSIDDLVQQSVDPGSEGLFDRVEYLLGVALTAIQQYTSCTYAQFKIGRSVALGLPPNIKPDLTLVTALNAGANFWKHMDEWGIRAVVVRDINSLSRQAQQTIRTIEALTPWDDYTLSNLVACLTPSSKLRLTELIPQLVVWRDAVDSLNAEIS